MKFFFLFTGLLLKIQAGLNYPFPPTARVSPLFSPLLPAPPSIPRRRLGFCLLPSAATAGAGASETEGVGSERSVGSHVAAPERAGRGAAEPLQGGGGRGGGAAAARGQHGGAPQEPPRGEPPQEAPRGAPGPGPRPRLRGREEGEDAQRGPLQLPSIYMVRVLICSCTTETSTGELGLCRSWTSVQYKFGRSVRLICYTNDLITFLSLCSQVCSSEHLCDHDGCLLQAATCMFDYLYLRVLGACSCAFRCLNPFQILTNMGLWMLDYLSRN